MGNTKYVNRATEHLGKPHFNRKREFIGDLGDLFKKRYVDEQEASIVTGRAVSTLRNDRHLRRGFPYLKIGRAVRYKMEDLISAMEAHRISFDD